MNLIKKYFFILINKFIKIYFPAILIGSFTGLTITFFNYSLSFINNYRNSFSKEILSHPIKMPILIFILLLNIYILAKLMDRFEMIHGSGIPHVKNILMESNRFKWFHELIGKFIASIISLGSGASLGKFGPSVQMGAKIGVGVSCFFKSNKKETLSLILSGVSAGIAAAFHTPFSGIMFVIEELKVHFSYLMLGCLITSTYFSHLISSQFIDNDSIFLIEYDHIIKPEDFPILVIFGILIVILAYIFNKLLKEFKSFYLWKSNFFRAASVLTLSFLCFMFIRDISGGGINIIKTLLYSNYSIKILIILFCIKFIFTLICCSSEIPGGTFIPILALGALSGKIYSEILIYFFNYDEAFAYIFVFLGMFAFYIAASKTPITGCFLMFELTGHYSYIPLLIIITVTIQLFSKSINRKKFSKFYKKLYKKNA